ncbi:rop-interactive crib motif-containing protein 4 [Musa troglodytarum]|uniref:Rop-interactive crib motif-containing protein 4 n=1 Tax=Musa troglodytarum TaxID=320322 RepID=A0A9E7IGW1_9LILI|nr:rop-interactive crib motif-containing protein 4 [Musa troglodytarum]URE47562.1 rop-interactive crib motif-containing protein 4 [Musa troglodytarum]
MSQRSRGKTAVPESKAKIWEDLACLEGPQEPYWSLQMARMLLVSDSLIWCGWCLVFREGKEGSKQVLGHQGR